MDIAEIDALWKILCKSASDRERKEQMAKKIEMIISYTTDGTDYQYCDNHGILVRCRDCKYYGINECEHALGLVGVKDDSYCSFAERREDE